MNGGGGAARSKWQADATPSSPPIKKERAQWPVPSTTSSSRSRSFCILSLFAGSLLSLHPFRALAAMVAPEAAERELRGLHEELAAKENALEVRDQQLDELRARKIAML